MKEVSEGQVVESFIGEEKVFVINAITAAQL